MQLNIHQKLYDFHGQSLPGPREDELTLADVLLTACSTGRPGGTGKDEAGTLFDLGLRVSRAKSEGGTVEISTSESSTLQDVVAGIYQPLASQQVCKILEGEANPLAPSEESEASE